MLLAGLLTDLSGVAKSSGIWGWGSVLVPAGCFHNDIWVQLHLLGRYI
jgi:hypothetical protein